MSCQYIFPYGSYYGHMCGQEDCKIHSKIIPGLNLQKSQLFMTFLNEIVDVLPFNDVYLSFLYEQCRDEFKELTKHMDTVAKDDLYTSLVDLLNKDEIPLRT